MAEVQPPIVPGHLYRYRSLIRSEDAPPELGSGAALVGAACSWPDAPATAPRRGLSRRVPSGL
jgi:hypothetical protein